MNLYSYLMLAKTCSNEYTIFIMLCYLVPAVDIKLLQLESYKMSFVFSLVRQDFDATDGFGNLLLMVFVTQNFNSGLLYVCIYTVLTKLLVHRKSSCSSQSAFMWFKIWSVTHNLCLEDNRASVFDENRFEHYVRLILNLNLISDWGWKK